MEFDANIDELRSMLKWIGFQIEGVGFDAKTLKQIELASEEALVNIISHAYQGRSEKVEIRVAIVPNSCVEITLIDSGPPFNPLNQKTADLSSSLEERIVGGLGIHLIRSIMDDVRYRREGNLNLLTLEKRITRSSSQTR